LVSKFLIPNVFEHSASYLKQDCKLVGYLVLYYGRMRSPV